MAKKNYFRYVPNFDYVSRLPNSKYINDYVQTKNLFKRLKISEQIFGDLTYFQKFIVKDNERPDLIAYKVYKESNLDWLVLLSNNIINYESEWPMDQYTFNNYILNKYGSYENMYNTHHYETEEVRDGLGNVILEKGLTVPQDFSVTFTDGATGEETIAQGITSAITNQEYEDRILESKQTIYLLKPIYISLVIEEIENLMPYKEGSTQYVGASLVKGDNIRLYS